jgi:hypothetical protein
MAIDQRDITSQLRMMDDRALQQYAAMHKSDPYIFPLAFQESQNRQKIRASKTAQMGGQEQPKVNEAALMAMTPQPADQGIGMLPAPNIARMADGGIAGYEDGAQEMADGGMFDFAQRNEPVMRMAGGGHIPRYQGKPIVDGGDGSVVDEFTGIDDQIAANLERQKLLGAFDDYSAYTPTPKKGSKAAKKEEAKKEDKKTDTSTVPAYTPKTAEEIRKSADLMAKPELEEIQKSYKPFAEQFAQDRARIEGREKNALSDMLIRGGLKAMAGKSQFALQNIAEGGLDALNAYQEGQKANEASRRALLQSEMQMTQAQRAERQGARGEALKLYEKAEQSQQAATQFGQKAEEIKNSKAYQEGSLLVQNRNADAAMVSALASRDRAAALNAAEKGALTPKDIAALRDKASDNVKARTLDSDKITAKKAAMMAGKPFDEKTWLDAQIEAEFNRLVQGLQTGKGVSIMKQTPTGGNLGGGTFNLSGWGTPEVVTPK